jgi:hypothetical protein
MLLNRLFQLNHSVKVVERGLITSLHSGEKLPQSPFDTASQDRIATIPNTSERSYFGYPICPDLGCSYCTIPMIGEWIVGVPTDTLKSWER